jgi:hypothetical protein
MKKTLTLRRFTVKVSATIDPAVRDLVSEVVKKVSGKEPI